MKKTEKRVWLDRGWMTLEEAVAFLKMENPEKREWTAEELLDAHKRNRLLFHSTVGSGSWKMAFSAMNRAFAKVEARMGL